MSEVLPFDPTITIRAETSQADPDTCKFTVSRTVHPGGPFFFDSKDRASGSPLVERFFALPGVSYVLVAETVVTVGKDPSVAWSVLKSSIGAAIRTQLLTGVPAIFEAPRNAGARGRTDAEVRAVVQELLDGEVNRSIAAHGGKISMVDFRDGSLLIAMSGGCQGCAASQVTLRQGFEVMVRGIAPEIVDIIDTTDHAAGKKPFYQRPG
jgi:NFU1 iron-sulfur cluster scaffold homolog, mitochondrial